MWLKIFVPNFVAIPLKDAELIKEFQKIEELPQEEKNTILKVISAYIRDFKTKQSYTL
ncbi:MULTISPECIES: hypothetical protein [Flavobacterium]|uniref:hypothetical protein n=1 Tax=Flavobacterium TaxID=237 RepID=UPI000B1A748D|nr:MULTISPECIES: hypothetical protein [Flavobacterium]MCJ1809589.1 hypothetical protein [Flavobacterium covae]